MSSEQDWSVSASIEVDAPADEVFDFIARPDNHVRLDGSGTVKGVLRPGKRLSRRGQRFTMRMRWVVPYIVTSKVSEFEEGRLIAWNHFAQHRWRWEVEDLGEGRSRITETFDASRAPLKRTYDRIGFPEGYQRILEESVRKVADAITAG